MDIYETIYQVALKHLQGQHNQKRHGWRYGSVGAARSAMRGQNAGERDEYRKRANMASLQAIRQTVKPYAPMEKPKPSSGLDIRPRPDDTKGWKKGSAKLLFINNENLNYSNYSGTPGYIKGDLLVSKGLTGKDTKWQVSSISSGSLIFSGFKSRESAMRVAGVIARTMPSIATDFKLKTDANGVAIGAIPGKKAQNEYVALRDAITQQTGLNMFNYLYGF